MLSLTLLLLTAAPQVFPLTSTRGLTAIDCHELKAADYRGKHAVFMSTNEDLWRGTMAVLQGVDFKDGTIEFDVAGMPNPRMPAGVRGFVGLAFRGSDDMETYENLYLRMTNGRSPDKVLRSHAVQYCCPPYYTWDELRHDHPGKYEAYSDLEVGAWTHIKIWVHGTNAKFYVGASKEPCLVVHDLIRGDTHGKVALWVTAFSSAYFSNLTISAE